MYNEKNLKEKRIAFFRILSILMLLILTGMFTGEALCSSESYPTKPIELIVPWSAGSATDLVGRFVGKYASQHFGQPIVVTNKPGAAGIIGTAEIVKSPADGYKLLLQSISFHVLVSKTQKIPFSPKLIIPVANFTEEIHGCFVNNDSPLKSFSDLIEFAKKNPGKLTWSHAGIGIPPYISMEMALRKAQIKAVSVPYKGTPEALAAVLGGHVKVGSMLYTACKEQVAAGKVRCLVVWRDTRFGELPDVPACTELGFQEAAKVRPFFGIYAHKDTPKEILKSVEDVCKKVYMDPEFQNDLKRLGPVPIFMNGSELKDFISQAEAEVTPTLKALGLYVGEN